MAWKIAVYQIPVGIGDIRHNFIVLKDDEGKPFAEFNGGPVDRNGRFITLDPADLSSINARISGGVVGAEIKLGSPWRFHDKPGAELLQETPVTPARGLAAYKAARACADEIRDLHLPYLISGSGRIIDHNSETNAPLGPDGFNSNGVASTLLACMGVRSTNPAIDRQPGAGRLILPLPRIQQIRQENTSPDEQIPVPRPRPQIRGDNSDGRWPATVGAGYREASLIPGGAGFAANTDADPWAMPGNGILSGVRLGPGADPNGPRAGLAGSGSAWDQAVREMWARRTQGADNS
jgi:hypothetical protein